MKSVSLALLLCLPACGAGDLGTPDPSGSVDAGAPVADATPNADADPLVDELDRERAQSRFVTTTDLMRYVIAPGCAAETNECHSNEDFPDPSTEGNLWRLIDLPCNLGVGDRTTVEDYCEPLGDEIRITDGANADFTATVGSIETVTDEAGEFESYVVVVDTALPTAQTGATFELLRGGELMGALGGGASLSGTAASTVLIIESADDLPDPGRVNQGDENGNGVYGSGEGVLVKMGDARASYLVHRLFGEQTDRIRMPLNENADNPTELNRPLSPDEMYAVMSWINCMRETDGVYSPIRYDCAANAENDGTW